MLTTDAPPDTMHDDDRTTGEDTSPENAPALDADLKQKRQVSWWQRLRRWWFRTDADRLREVDELTDAIDHAPDEGANYLLRAELYMELKQYVLALEDYQQAQHLAEAALTREGWGISAQATRDRAIRGIAQADRYS